MVVDVPIVYITLQIVILEAVIVLKFDYLKVVGAL